jgi:hypothetical protein
VAPVAGVNEFFKDLLDFKSWAPRSSQIWRLNQYAYTEGDLIQRKKGAPALCVLRVACSAVLWSWWW